MQSDRIYKNGSLESDYYRRLIGLSRGKFTFECEFGKDAITSTWEVRGGGGNNWKRIVFLGTFNTKKGLSGRLDAFAVGDKQINGKGYEVNIVKLARPKAFSGYQQLQSIVQDNPPSEPTAFYSNYPPGDRSASNGILPVSSLSKLAPTGFLPFYRASWWENPFKSDLV